MRLKKKKKNRYKHILNIKRSLWNKSLKPSVLWTIMSQKSSVFKFCLLPNSVFYRFNPGQLSELVVCILIVCLFESQPESRKWRYDGLAIGYSTFQKHYRHNWFCIGFPFRTEYPIYHKAYFSRLRSIKLNTIKSIAFTNRNVIIYYYFFSGIIQSKIIM